MINNAIAKLGDNIIIDYHSIKEHSKLYICVVLKNGSQQFNILDIDDIEKLIIDTKMPIDTFNKEFKVVEKMVKEENNNIQDPPKDGEEYIDEEGIRKSTFSKINVDKVPF